MCDSYIYFYFPERYIYNIFVVEDLLNYMYVRTYVPIIYPYGTTLPYPTVPYPTLPYPSYIFDIVNLLTLTL